MRKWEQKTKEETEREARRRMLKIGNAREKVSCLFSTSL